MLNVLSWVEMSICLLLESAWVREREREREKERERMCSLVLRCPSVCCWNWPGWDIYIYIYRERERESVCVCVCVCVLSLRLVCPAVSEWRRDMVTVANTQPFMLPGEVTQAEWCQSFSLDEILSLELQRPN